MSFFSRLLSVPKAYPFAFGMTFSCAKTSASDLMVQLGLEKREFKDIDWRRNSAFAAFGLLYLGGVQYTIYVPVFSRLFPGTVAFAAKPVAQKIKDIPGMAAVGAQVAAAAAGAHGRMDPRRARVRGGGRGAAGFARGDGAVTASWWCGRLTRLGLAVGRGVGWRARSAAGRSSSTSASTTRSCTSRSSTSPRSS